MDAFWAVGFVDSAWSVQLSCLLSLSQAPVWCCPTSDAHKVVRKATSSLLDLERIRQGQGGVWIIASQTLGREQAGQLQYFTKEESETRRQAAGNPDSQVRFPAQSSSCCPRLSTVSISRLTDGFVWENVFFCQQTSSLQWKQKACRS